MNSDNVQPFSPQWFADRAMERYAAGAYSSEDAASYLITQFSKNRLFREFCEFFPRFPPIVKSSIISLIIEIRDRDYVSSCVPPGVDLHDQKWVHAIVAENAKNMKDLYTHLYLAGYFTTR